MVGSQQNLAWISLAVSVLFFLILFTARYSILITIHIIGLIYYFFITASFLLNYPNIAFGIMSLVSIALFMEILNLIDESEEVKKMKILNDDSYEYKGGE
jgi:chromate transport protein ChrA